MFFQQHMPGPVSSRAHLIEMTPVVDPGGAAPPFPQDFFQIMQFSCNFKGKTPIFSKFWAQGPLGSKFHWAPLTKILDPRLDTPHN